jgi:hypothetical protein
LSGALYVLGKGKGKSKGGGKGGHGKSFSKGGFGGCGKNGGKGMETSGYEPKRKGKGHDGGKVGVKTFDGFCNYCWKYGRRKSECRMLDAEMAKKGGGKGKGKSTYDLQEEEEEFGTKDDKEDTQENPEEEWWEGTPSVVMMVSFGWTRAVLPDRAALEAP